MKVLILGATGRTGKIVLQRALEEGYEVNCLARNSIRIRKQNRLTVFEGNPTNTADLENAFSDCNAVISVLNVSRKSDFPWSKLRTPENYLSETMKVLIPIAEKRNVKRIVVCSAWGAAETKKDTPGWFRWFIDHSNIGAAYRDHERQEKLLSDSNLDWTIVRPVGLINSTKNQKVKESFDNNPKPNLIISRKTVGEYLIACMRNKALIKHSVVISAE
ncbi:MAG TPA: NAD(P)-binding oxidoreductase [Cyclobacteriaceae bacterium]|nr:NAD(P)-binding oxidoreductase [Cyclobacteriaceae bacterium]